MDPTRRSFDVARALLDCVCLALDSTSAGCPSRRCVVPGSEADFTSCCGGPKGGQLTINIESVHASTAFPIPDTTPNKCTAPYEVVAYNVTILRCVPTGDIDHGPSCDQLEAVAFTTFVDQAVVREAVRCCLSDTDSLEAIAGAGYRWLLDEHPMVGPEGGCVGSSLRIFIGLIACHDCEEVGL